MQIEPVMVTSPPDVSEESQSCRDLAQTSSSVLYTDLKLKSHRDEHTSEHIIYKKSILTFQHEAFLRFVDIYPPLP